MGNDQRRGSIHILHIVAVTKGILQYCLRGLLGDTQQETLFYLFDPPTDPELLAVQIPLPSLEFMQPIHTQYDAFLSYMVAKCTYIIMYSHVFPFLPKQDEVVPQSDQGAPLSLIDWGNYLLTQTGAVYVLSMGGQMSQNSISITAAFQCIYRTSYLSFYIVNGRSYIILEVSYIIQEVISDTSYIISEVRYHIRHLLYHAGGPI